MKKMLAAVSVLTALCCVGSMAVTAQAAPQTAGVSSADAKVFGPPIGDDYPYKNAEIGVVDKWNFYTRNCTSFVAHRVATQTKVKSFSNGYGGHGVFGNAAEWVVKAPKIGLKVDTTPAVGAAAVWPAGHIAWVYSINSQTGRFHVEEYNWNWTYNYGRRTSLDSRGPNAAGVKFIHFEAWR